jgi:aminoglycoside phosphotransferase (APT) family kinase protein
MSPMRSEPDLDALARLSADPIGETNASAWALVDQGFGSLVYTADGWIVRVSRNSDAQKGHELELRLLRALDGRLPVSVPSAPVRIQPGRELPFGALAYRAIPGRQMRREDGALRPELAIELTDALAALHAVPISEAEELGVPRPDPSAELMSIREATEPFLETELEPALAEALAGWWDETQGQPQSFQPVLCHGDPWYGNLLVADDHLVALLDFEGARISDPAVDLAATFHMGRLFGEAAIGRYLELEPTRRSLPAAVERYRLVRELAGLAYVLRHAWADEVPDAVAKVRAVLSDQCP